jgi:hypothetical protein
MYQTIDEPIQVAGVYAQGKFTPKKFQWRQKPFVISQITSVHDFKDGSVRRRKFAVVAQATVFLLEFNREQESWMLEQIWVE